MSLAKRVAGGRIMFSCFLDEPFVHLDEPFVHLDEPFVHLDEPFVHR
jgi:hypothetical protein